MKKQLVIYNIRKKKIDITKYLLEMVIAVETVISVVLYREYVKSAVPMLLLMLFVFYIGLLLRLYSLLKGKKVNIKLLRKCKKPVAIFIRDFAVLVSISICIALPNVAINNQKIKDTNSYKAENIQFVNTAVSFEENNYYEEFSFPKNKEYLQYVLSNEKFQMLEYEEKEKVIESILYWEANRLGVPEFNYEITDLPDYIAGHYNVATNTININRKCIDNGYHIEYIAGCCIHEVRHVYQLSLCRIWFGLTPEQRALSIFNDQNIEEMCSNYLNYTSFEEDADKYNSQIVETDADAYAKEELKELINTVKVNFYISEY